MTIIEQIEQRKKFLSKGILNSLSNQEVITPISLVEEMLDKLPEDIWKNPDLTWADPCSKSGSFPLEIIYRLMKNLPIESETLRYEHIINNMVSVYVNADRNKWVVAKAVYGDVSEVGKLKLLEIDKLKENDMPKFDVVVGNPPFQNSKESKGNTGRIKGLEKNLYQKFILLGINLLNENGYISLISPPGYLKSTQWGISNNCFSELNVLDILNIKLNGILKHFKVKTPLTYFVAKKTKKRSNNTLIESFEKVERDISNDFHVPSSIDKYTYSIISKMQNPVGNSINPKFFRTNDRPEKEFVCIKGMNNRSKTIDARNSPDEFSGADLIWETDNAKYICETYNTSPFLYLIRRLYYDAVIYFGVINGFKIPEDTSKSYSNKELYDFYGFTEEEINSIENFGIYYLE